MRLTLRLKENRIPFFGALFVLFWAASYAYIWIFLPEWQEFSSASMKFNTACGLTASAVTLLGLSLRLEGKSRLHRILLMGCSWFVLLLGALTGIQYITGISFGIDQLVVEDFISAESQLFPGRMSPIAAACFMLTGLALLGLQFVKDKGQFIHPTPLLIFPVQALSLLALTGYLYDVHEFYKFGPFIRIAWQSAICFFVLSGSLFFYKPRKGHISILTSPRLGGVTARRLLPMALAVPIILGWLKLEGQNLNFYDLELGSALRTVISIWIFVGLIFWNARVIEGLDKERERKESDLKDALNARDEFVSIASHELKTPLTTLKLQSDIEKRYLAKNDMSAFTPEKLASRNLMDQRQLARLARLVDDMLDISRITSGKFSMQLEQVELCALVGEVVERLRPDWERAHYSVTLDLCEPVTGTWDRFRLEQIVMNLLTNAIKYGNGKPIKVSVKKLDGWARIEFRDHGIGIDKKNHERIFRRFERAVSLGAAGGLGLGLYITKQIVEMHNGKISVDSEPGEGSVFTVELPV